MTSRKVAVTTSGLAQADKEALQARLKGLTQLGSRGFLMGGADRAKINDAITRITQRLNPEQPALLIKTADAVLQQYVPNATWVSEEIRDEVMRAVG